MLDAKTLLLMIAASKSEVEIAETVIHATQNTQIDSNVVPLLTSDQVVQAYNVIVAGGSCVITDVFGMINLKVTQANSINGQVIVYAMYFDRLILCYKDDGTVTGKSI